MKCTLWISQIFELDPEAVKPHHRVCSRQFFNANPKDGPCFPPVKVMGPLKDSKFVEYKNYNLLAAWKDMVLVTPQVASSTSIAYLSYLQS